MDSDRKPGNIEVNVNGNTLLYFHPEEATAWDCIKFISDVVDLLSSYNDVWEAKAQNEGRTINHKFSGIGSIPVNPL